MRAEAIQQAIEAACDAMATAEVALARAYEISRDATHEDDPRHSSVDMQAMADAYMAIKPALAALRAIPAEGWEEIGEKHRDGGKWILARGERVTVGYRQVEEDGFQEHGDENGEYQGLSFSQGWECWCTEDGGFTEDEPPTHARPLPQPPSGKVGG